MLKERMELLEIGQALGWPRLRYGRKQDGTARMVKAGEVNWEQFCAHAHSTRIPPVLRIGRVLRNAGVVPYNPLVAEPVTANLPREMMVDLKTTEQPTTPAPLSNAERQRRFRERKARGLATIGG